MTSYRLVLIFLGLIIITVIFRVAERFFSASEHYVIKDDNIPSIELMWEAELLGETIGSHVIIDDSRSLVFVTTYSALTALNVDTGKVRWVNEDSGGNQWSDRNIQLQNGLLLAKGNQVPILKALSSETGELIWERDYSTNQDNSRNWTIFSILSDASRAYIATRRINRGTDIEALDILTGQPVWTVSANKVFDQQGPTNFLLTKNRLYIEAGNLYGIDKETGDILEVYPSLLKDSKNGIIDDNAAYYTDGVLRSVRLYPNKEESVWYPDWHSSPARYPDGVNRLFTNVNTQADFLYAGASCNSLIRWCTSVLKFNKNTGELVWSADTKGSPTSVAIEENDLFALTTNATLVHVDVISGDVLGSLQFSPESNNMGHRDALAYSKGWLIVGNGNNQLFGFRKIE